MYKYRIMFRGIAITVDMVGTSSYDFTCWLAQRRCEIMANEHEHVRKDEFYYEVC